MQKSLDQKLAALHADPSEVKEFILADAKDPDMGFGVPGTGRLADAEDGTPRYHSREQFLQHIREIVADGVVDIMLMSASTSEKLTIEERLFDDSHVTPAVRANDTTDIYGVRGGRYQASASRPFRSATIDHIQCGHLDCRAEERSRGADLGLYSMTFNNSLEDDLRSAEAFKAFREEAERKGFRYFLEVFDPNVADAVSPELMPSYVNDMIARTLGGVTKTGMPLFLKVAYHGPHALEELINYDENLIVGMLGGSAGTTRDAFQLIHDAQKYGARVALFGRKINNAEDQVLFIRFLRRIVDGDIEPAEAVRAYHAELETQGIAPHRAIERDVELESHVTDPFG